MWLSCGVIVGWRGCRVAWLSHGHIAVALYEGIRGIRKQRYHADVSKLLPLTYAVVFLLIIVGLAAVYLDLRDPIAL